MEEYRGLIIYLVFNAVIGLISFEWAWYTTRRHRKPILELSAQFPELCRNDAPKWKKWKHYPGAITFLVPRFVICLALGLLMALVIKLCLIGYGRERPLEGCRKWLCRITF